MWALKADRVPRSLKKTNAQCQGDKGAPAWHQKYSLFSLLLILLAIFFLNKIILRGHMCRDAAEENE